MCCLNYSERKVKEAGEIMDAFIEEVRPEQAQKLWIRVGKARRNSIWCKVKSIRDLPVKSSVKCLWAIRLRTAYGWFCMPEKGLMTPER